MLNISVALLHEKVLIIINKHIYTCIDQLQNVI